MTLIWVSLLDCRQVGKLVMYVFQAGVKDLRTWASCYMYLAAMEVHSRSYTSQSMRTPRRTTAHTTMLHLTFQSQIVPRHTRDKQHSCDMYIHDLDMPHCCTRTFKSSFTVSSALSTSRFLHRFVHYTTPDTFPIRMYAPLPPLPAKVSPLARATLRSKCY